MAKSAVAVVMLAGGAAAFAPGAAPLRGFSAPSLRATSRRPSSLKMVDKDYVDAALGMLKTLQGDLKKLDDVELARLSGVCTRLTDDILIMRKNSGTAGPINMASHATTQGMSQSEIEAANDAFFNDGTSFKDLLDQSDLPRTPTPAAAPPAAAPAARAAAPQAQAAAPKAAPAARAQTNSEKYNQVTETGKAISKYTSTVRPEVIKTSTPESDVSEDEWAAEYRKIFGSEPSTEPMIDDETPRPPPPPELEHLDAFSAMRKVQAGAKDYATPADYYAALNLAISNWKDSRSERGELQGTAVADRYMDQLSTMSPFDENNQGKKFSLDVMLVEETGKDAEGKFRGVLVMSDVDPPGALGMAGCRKGDALLAVNGVDVTSYADLKKAMAPIHEARQLTADILVQRKKSDAPELFRVSSE
mmetsp:Transcript_29727/g.68187  ORF Transcript_29727/g.68187 Transcript_29727/m.68187 type:complete len:418 (-) Transcript_29727:146-1399(-)